MRGGIPICPAAGQGVHHWLMVAAHSLKRRGVSRGGCQAYLSQHATRSLQSGEIERVLGKVYDQEALHRSSLARERLAPRAVIDPRKAVVDSEKVREVTSTGVTLEALRNLSPRTPESVSQIEVLKALYPEGALICCAKGKNWGCDTKTLEQWVPSLKFQQFIVPQAMTRRRGVTKEGKESPRSQSNTGEWMYYVYESDSVSIDDQAAIIASLMKRMGLVLVVFSGGKSLHAWFDVRGIPDAERLRFQRECVTLAGCVGTLSSCQLVRMPLGKNSKTGMEQQVIFFNPAICR